jgi:hypothetical protein
MILPLETMESSVRTRAGTAREFGTFHDNTNKIEETEIVRSISAISSIELSVLILRIDNSMEKIADICIRIIDRK